MNIALSAILIALLLLPGALFRVAYTRGTFRRSFAPFNPIGEDLAAVLFANVFVYTASLFLLPALGIVPRVDVLLPLLAGNYGTDAKYLSAAIAYFQNPPLSDAFAYLLLTVGSFLAGFAAHLTVRRFGLDLRFQSMRFNNEWYYALDEWVNRVADTQPRIYVVLAVDLKTDTYLYRGRIKDWILDRGGTLERFVLGDAERRKLSDDAELEVPSVWYPIRSDRVLIRYSDCRSVALEYAYAPDASEEEVQEILGHVEVSQVTLTSGDQDLSDQKLGDQEPDPRRR